MKVQKAVTDDQIAACHSTIHQLRPHVAADGFVERVRSMEASDRFALAFIEQDQRVVAVAGYRLMDKLHTGLSLYVDDLITAGDIRSRGHGTALLDWLVQQARLLGARVVELDSGVQRVGAHRFYLGARMFISSYHFARPLDTETPTFIRAP